jgi:ribosomal protein S18 acetylase RimI-like enzyme
MIMFIREISFKIRAITRADLDAVLDMYAQCEDFLALGPVPTASMEMVLKDIEISQAEGGVFCGITTGDGQMIGVVDFVSRNFEGDLQAAFLSLLMIAAPFRKQGFGKAIVAAVEKEIQKDAQVKAILAGVQVNNPQAVRF